MKTRLTESLRQREAIPSSSAIWNEPFGFFNYWNSDG